MTNEYHLTGHKRQFKNSSLTKKHFLDNVIFHNVEWAMPQQLNWTKENTAGMDSINAIPPWPVESVPNRTVQELKSNKTITFNLKNSANVEVFNILGIFRKELTATKRQYKLISQSCEHAHCSVVLKSMSPYEIC